MSAEYAPGTVAIATVRGVKGMRVISTPEGYWYAPAELAGMRAVSGHEITDLRPLVVLDLGDWSSDFVGLIPKWLRIRAHSAPSESAVRAIADQIEAQTKPPRIPEPGLWGVVRAGEVNAVNENDWLRTPGGNWVCVLGSRVVAWEALVDPVLIREGVESDD